jgi:hypothetical protein
MVPGDAMAMPGAKKTQNVVKRFVAHLSVAAAAAIAAMRFVYVDWLGVSMEFSGDSAGINL